MAQLKLVEAAGRDPAAALRLSEDDFSVRVASSEDPIYWVRVERDSMDVVSITDFNPGSRAVEVLEAGLLMAIRAMPQRRFFSFVFQDLIPGIHQQPDVPVRLVRTADLAKTLASSIAAHLGQIVTSFRLEHRDGKYDAVLSLGSR